MKILTKMEILIENGNFDKKNEILTKMEVLSKNGNFDHNPKF